MLDEYDRCRLKRLNRLKGPAMLDFMCARIERLTPGELRRQDAPQLAELRSPTLRDRMMELRAKFVEMTPEDAVSRLAGRRSRIITTFGLLRRAMASARRGGLRTAS